MTSRTRTAEIQPTSNPARVRLVLFYPDGRKTLCETLYTSTAERARRDWMNGEFLPHILDYVLKETGK